MLRLLTTKTNTIGKTALLLTTFLISSSVLAVVRDKIFSTQFGAGELLDTYMAAFKIPDLVFLLVGTLISTFIIIPFLEKEEKQGRDLQIFIDKLFFTFFVFIFSAALIIFMLLPFIAPEFFPGFNEEQIKNLVWMARIMLLSPIFISLASVFSSVNQKNNYFFPTALTGVFYNLSIIFGTLVLYPFFGMVGVVFGVVLGALLYLLLQLPPILREGRFIRKIHFFSLSEVADILKTSAPRSIALVIADVLLIYLISMATLLGAGSVTILNFSLNIFLVPISIIAISYSVAVFPKLAKAYADENIDRLKELSRDVISRILFFGIPISVFFIFFSQPIVGFLLGSEKFGLPEISLTAVLVSIFAVGIVFQALVIMIVRIFYAMGKTWVPLVTNVFLALAMVSIVMGMQRMLPADFFIPGDARGSGLVVLAIAYLSAFVIDFFVITLLFKKTITNFSLFKGSEWFSKIIMSLVAVLFAWLSFIYLAPETQNSFLTFFWQLAIAGIAFLVVFILISEYTRDNNYLEFKEKIFAILNQWKSK